MPNCILITPCFLANTYKRQNSLNFMEEIDNLHAAVMALEQLLVEKGLVSVEELNSALRKAQEEVKRARESGKVVS